MKKILSYCMAALLATSAASCDSDNNHFNGDTTQIRRIISERPTLCFKRSECDIYLRENSTKWDKINPHDWTDLSVPGSHEILMIDGNLWSPLDLMEHCGEPSSKLILPLEIYNRWTQTNKKFYISADCQLAENCDSIVLESEKFEILGSGEKYLQLRQTSPVYTVGENEVSHQWRYDITYLLVPIESEKLEEANFYDSKLDACLDIIRLLRERFGDEFDLNVYLSGLITLDYPICNLDKIEVEIRAAYSR